MSKPAKILAAVAAVLVLLVAAAAVALRLALPPAKLKALALEQAGKTLHRAVDAQAVELGLFSGLTVRGLRVSQAPDFSRGEFLKAESLTVRPRWLPLLRKRLEIGSLELDGARVAVVKERDGRFNFSDLLGAPAAAAKTPAVPSAPPALSVGALRLRDARLAYVDRAQSASADLAIADARLDGFSFSGPFSASIDAQARYAGGGRRLSAAFKAQGRLDLAGGDLAGASADVSRFSLALQGKEITGSLRLTGGKTSKASLRLSMPADARLPAVEASVEAAYSAPRLDVTSLKASAAGARLSGSASIPDVSSARPRLELRLEGTLGALAARLSGAVGDLYGDTRTLDLRLEAPRFPLASLASEAPQLKAYALTGSAALSAAIAGTTSAPRVSGAATLDGVGAAYRGQRLEKTSGQARFTQESLELPQLSGRLNGGDFRLKLSAAGGAAPSVSVSGWLSLLDLGALQKLAEAPSSPSAAGKPAPAARAAVALRATGDVTIDKTIHPNFECGKAALSWNLTGITPDMRRLAGTARLLVGPGRATNLLDFAAARGGLVRALVVPLEAVQKARALRIPGFNPPDMQNVPFDKIEGVYAASRGVVSMQPFSLQGPVIGVTTTGKVDLPAATVALETAVKSSLGDVSLSITGPMSSPSIRPDVSKTLESTGKKLLEQKGQQLLDQWLKRR